MKRVKFLYFIVLCLVLITADVALAKRGCCSWHGGVNHCDVSTGRIVCNDVTYSPSCVCERESKNMKFRPDTMEPPESQLEQE